MPSAQTHDRITLAFVAPIAAIGFAATRDPIVALVAAATLVLGGFMFGPDLDIASRQYRRWGPVRFVWLPYRWTMRHRSRLSHGMLFGTAVRVAYFLVVLCVGVTAAFVVRDVYVLRMPASPHLAVAGVEQVWGVASRVAPVYHAAAFVGLWVGAASHTIADIVGSTVKAVWKAL